MIKKDTGQTPVFGDMIYDRLFRKRSLGLKKLAFCLIFSYFACLEADQEPSDHSIRQLPDRFGHKLGPERFPVLTTSWQDIFNRIVEAR